MLVDPPSSEAENTAGVAVDVSQEDDDTDNRLLGLGCL